MEAVLRALVVYVALLLIFRVTGNRALAKINSFDLVLLLIIGEAASQGLIGEDYSITNALLVIGTLVCIELGLTMVKHRFPIAEKLIDDVPVVIVRDGEPDLASMARVRIDIGDVLEAARKTRGLCEMADIRLAVLERDGQISIIPYAEGGAPA